MSDCRKCARFEECAVDEDCGLFVDKPMTNADRIRTMTDEELAIWLSAIMYCSNCVAEIPCAKEITTKFCKDILCDWLKSPVEPVEVDNG